MHEYLSQTQVEVQIKREMWHCGTEPMFAGLSGVPVVSKIGVRVSPVSPFRIFLLCDRQGWEGAGQAIHRECRRRYRSKLGIFQSTGNIQNTK